MTEKPSVAFPDGFLAELDVHAKAAKLSRSAFIVKAVNRAMGKTDDWRPNRSPVATLDATQPAEEPGALPAQKFRVLAEGGRPVCVECGKAQARHSLTGACPL